MPATSADVSHPHAETAGQAVRRQQFNCRRLICRAVYFAKSPAKSTKITKTLVGTG